MRWTLLLFAIVGISACSSPSEPAAEDARLEFRAEKAQAFVESPEITVTGGNRTVTIVGGLSTPCAGYTLNAEAIHASAITLRVIANANSSGGGCYTVVETFVYEAVLRGLPAGTYAIRVLHVFKQGEADPDPEVREVKIASAQVR